jgi:hypothetical protein
MKPEQNHKKNEYEKKYMWLEFWQEYHVGYKKGLALL